MEQYLNLRVKESAALMDATLSCHVRVAHWKERTVPNNGIFDMPEWHRKWGNNVSIAFNELLASYESWANERLSEQERHQGSENGATL